MDIERDLDAAMPLVEIDAEQIVRLLTNLLDNGIAAIRAQRLAEPRLMVRSGLPETGSLCRSRCQGSVSVRVHGETP